MSQWERIVWIDREIRAGKYPNPLKLMEKFEICRRTAFQDREYMINRLDAPIKFNTEKKGWYYSDPSFSFPAIMMSDKELIAFLLSKGLTKEYLGSPFAEALGMVFNKMLQYLPEEISVDLGEIANRFVLVNSNVIECSPELLQDIDNAIKNQLAVDMNYYSAHSDSTAYRTIEPYHLLNVQGEWHLVAYCRLRGDYRQFLLNRIREWYVTSEKFERKPEFDIKEYLKSGLLVEHGAEPENIVLKFSANAARWIIERPWHPSQSLEKQSDGSVIMRLSVGGTGELKRWVLRFGSEVEVLEPKSLRKAMKDDIEKMKKLYTK